MQRAILLFFIVLPFSAIPLKAHSKIRHNQKMTRFSATVISCHDGDTCRVKFRDETIKIRFAGIDAPEIGQVEGNSSKEFLESKILKKTIDLDCQGKSYDRLVCQVYLEGADINEEMVRQGYALDYAAFSKGKYKVLMEAAKRNKIGIWRSLFKSPFCTRHEKDKNCLSDALYNQ